MPKTIWIVNYYNETPDKATHLRHLSFAKHLEQNGYHVILFAASSVIEKKIIESVIDGYNFVHIKTISYNGSLIKRAFSIFWFAFKLYLLRNKFEKPDLIVHNIHEPFDYPICWTAKRLKSKYIVDDWDLWADSFADFGFVKKGGIIEKFIFKIDELFFINADEIIFSMEGGIDYIKDKGWDLSHGGKVDLKKINYINNGVDLKQNKKNIDLYQRDDSDLLSDKFKVVYMGSISKANAVHQIIEAANVLKKDIEILFLIYGDGTERDRLEQYCKDNNIYNVIFKERRINLKEVPFILSKCQLNIVNHRQGLKYGVSFGKLFQALASGKPICSNCYTPYDLINRYNLGICKTFENSTEYANSINTIKNLSQKEYEEMCYRVECVAREFDYGLLSEKFVKIVNRLLI